MKATKRVVRNSIFGILSQAVGGGVFFLVMLLIARELGPERFGTFSYIFAFVTVFHMFADFGLTNILIRELARNQQNLGQILGAVIPLVTIIAIGAYVIILVSTIFLPISNDAQMAMCIMGAIILVGFPAAVYGAVCRAFEDMGFNAAGLIAQRLLLLVLVLLALNLKSGLVGYALCYLGEIVFQWLFFYLIVRKRYTKYRWRLDMAYWRYLIVEGLPIGAGTVLRRISWYLDIFLLMVLSTASSVGLFSAAYRIIRMVNVIPFTLSVPLFPPLSRFGVESKEKAYALFRRATNIFILIGLPISLWMVLLGPQLMAVLFGDHFLSAGSTLRIMGVVVLFLFLNSLYLYLFTALGKQKLYTFSIGFSVLINIILDFILIPILDIQGAAIGTLCAEFTLYLSGIYFLRRLGFKSHIGSFLPKTLFTVLLASIVLLWPLYLPTWNNIILGTIGFAVCLLLVGYFLKIFTRDEMMALLSLIPNR